MKRFFRILLVCVALPPTLSYGSCPEPHLGLETEKETLQALKNQSRGDTITCMEDLGATMDARQYVITINESSKTARLQRTGGAWGKSEDFGITTISIEKYDQGYVPATMVRSVDPLNRLTDELDLKIHGALGYARIRLDDGKRQTYISLTLKCE